jgi:hypothetical protein
MYSVILLAQRPRTPIPSIHQEVKPSKGLHAMTKNATEKDLKL